MSRRSPPPWPAPPYTRREAAQREIAGIVERLRALDPGAAAYCEFVAAYGGDELAAARKKLDEARPFLPYAEIAHMEVWLDFKVGRPSAALEHLREMTRADPLDIVASSELVAALYALGRLDEAEAEYRRSLDLPGTRTIVEPIAMYMAVTKGYPPEIVAERKARHAATLSAAMRQAAADPPSDRQAWIGSLERDLAGQPNPLSEGPYMIAWWADYLGDAGLTVRALRKTLEQRGAGYGLGLFSPALTNVRKDPRFKDLLRDYGYYAYWKQTNEWSDFCHPVGEDDFECR